MNPKIFSYKSKSSVIELSVYPITIESCLELFERGEGLRLVEFGATCYKNFGWVDQDNFKEFGFVSDLIDLFETEGDIGFSICHAVIGGECTLIAHDDGRAMFQVNSDKECNKILVQLAGANSGLIISHVKKHEGQFVGINEMGSFEKFSSIRHFVEKRA